MTGNFQKTTSNIFVTLLIGLIVVSFMFTGYESLRGSPNDVAKVGGHSITVQEYQREYSRQIQFYKNTFFQGRELTTQEIERFNIKGQVLKNLVQNKLRLIFADKTDVAASPSQVKKTIKNFDFFKTNGQFDINRYKGLLQVNGLTPKEFEKDITQQVYAENVEALFDNFPVSDAYISDIARFKEERYNAYVVEVSESELRPLISVTAKEVKEYLKNEANAARTENLFKERKKSLDVPEKVKASHILISKTENEAKDLERIKKIALEVNPSNFKTLANKYTEDPSGKDKGGSLGLFARGRMVPEFEKVAFSQQPGTISAPVKSQFGYHLILVEKKVPGTVAKFEDHRDSLAQELIRKEKSPEVKDLLTSVTNEVSKDLKSGNIKGVEKLKARYKFSFDNRVVFNKYEGSLGQINIPEEQSKTIFEALKTKDQDSFVFNLAGKNLIVALEKSYDKNLPDFDAKKEKSNLQRVLSSKMKEEVFKKLGDNIPVKQLANI